MPTVVRAAAVQLTSGADRDANLTTAGAWVTTAAEQGAELIVLPELVSALGSKDVLRAAA